MFLFGSGRSALRPSASIASPVNLFDRTIAAVCPAMFAVVTAAVQT